MAELTPEEFARNSFRGVMMSIYFTFNLGDEPNVPYTFDRKTREAVDEHVKALYALFHRGKLTPKQGALAQADSDFQRFMGKVNHG